MNDMPFFTFGQQVHPNCLMLQRFDLNFNIFKTFLNKGYRLR